MKVLIVLLICLMLFISIGASLRESGVTDIYNYTERIYFGYQHFNESNASSVAERHFDRGANVVNGVVYILVEGAKGIIEWGYFSGQNYSGILVPLVYILLVVSIIPDVVYGMMVIYVLLVMLWNKLRKPKPKVEE